MYGGIIGVIGAAGSYDSTNNFWDITSYTEDNGNFNLQEVNTNYNPSDIAIKPDGSKLYVLNFGNGDSIEEYDFGTPWDITTLTFTSRSLNLMDVGFISGPRGLEFRDDGSMLFLLQGNQYFRIDLSPNWDIISANSSSQDSFLISGSPPVLQSAARMNSDGTKLYVAGTGSIHQYSFGTAYDVSTLSYDGIDFNLNFDGTSGDFVDIHLKPDDTELYVTNTDTATIQQYSFGTPGDLSTLTYNSSSLSLISIGFGQQIVGIYFKDNGSTLYLTEYTNKRVYQFNSV